ncbi:MAG: LLM class flavin-dependent oxidoreductase [Chloroflexi bacterium]|nr:LLM class flavin-dependent oxidoreductase [Chloroflexota bacterium]MCH8008270.1 LLM class flavin-dependent oxidoreductase [Chloroflexota bacterium]
MQMPTILIPTGAWNMRAGISSEEVLDAARKAEEAGIDGLFAGDHVTFYGNGNDGLVNLAAVATVTERAKLMTSVYLLALRHPTPVALQCAMIDQLSNGRLILGVGIGGEDKNEWLACGIDPRTRARRTDEALQILRSLWTQEETTFEGKYFQLNKVRMQPKPMRDEGIPIHIGGRSDAALRRTARYGDAWTAIWVSARRMNEAREKIDEWAAKEGRDGSKIGLGLQLWHSVDGDRDEARRRLSKRMQGFYQIPFENFEKYCPYGSPEEIAEYLGPFLEAGMDHVNLLAVQGSQQGVVEAASAVKEALAKVVNG